jgi:hypothetical protein
MLVVMAVRHALMHEHQQARASVSCYQRFSFCRFFHASSHSAVMRLLPPVALLLWVVTCYNVAASALGPMRTFLTTFTIPPDVQPEQELVRASH